MANKYSGVRTGWWITDGTKLAIVRDGVALFDCSRWELLKKLAEGDWQLKLVRKHSHFPEPYSHGHAKYWYLLVSKNALEKGDCLLCTRSGRGV